MTKTCNRCCETKPESEFFENPRMLSGRYNTCRDCYNRRQEHYRKKKVDGDPLVNELMRAWR